ncbi:uncharacterized protein [Nicotiana sylvestris]|uniref:uncharacterized protein n=1 Tax=Nicotiana sylvestris TaxID=4096 RepID=UPI00388CA4C4
MLTAKVIEVVATIKGIGIITIIKEIGVVEITKTIGVATTKDIEEATTKRDGKLIKGQHGTCHDRYDYEWKRWECTHLSSKRKLVDDEQVVQEYETPNNVVQVNDEVRIDIDDNMEETQEEVNPSRDHIVDIPELVVQKAKAPLPKPPPPYPQRLAKQNGKNQFKNFIDMMKSILIDAPFVEALEQMPGYAKFMKAFVTKKRSMNCETIKMTHQVSAIVHSMAPNLEDPGAFIIPCTIGSAEFAKAFCDLGESINLMPYSVFNTLGIGQPRPTSMRLQMVDRTMKRPLRVIEDVLVHVDKFILPADFVILDCEVDYELPIIL